MIHFFRTFSRSHHYSLDLQSVNLINPDFLGAQKIGLDRSSYNEVTISSMEMTEDSAVL